MHQLVVTVPLGFYPASTALVQHARGNLLTCGPNRPFGLSILGRRFSEEKLIGYAYAFEQATQVISHFRFKDFWLKLF